MIIMAMICEFMLYLLSYFDRTTFTMPCSMKKKETFGNRLAVLQTGWRVQPWGRLEEAEDGKLSSKYVYLKVIQLSILYNKGNAHVLRDIMNSLSISSCYILSSIATLSSTFSFKWFSSRVKVIVSSFILVLVTSILWKRTEEVVSQ